MTWTPSLRFVFLDEGNDIFGRIRLPAGPGEGLALRPCGLAQQVRNLWR